MIENKCFNFEMDIKVNCVKHGNNVPGRVMPLNKIKFCLACLEEKSRKSQEKEIKHKELVKYYKYLISLKNSGITKMNYDCEFNIFKPEVESQKYALAKCKEYSDNFPLMFEIGRGLVMLGNSGLGKTHLACTIAKKVMAKDKKNVLYMKFFQLNLFQYKEISLENLIKCDLLIIDEIGVSKNDTKIDRLQEIIDLRHDAMLPIILISNLLDGNSGKDNEFNTLLPNAINSRLKQNTVRLNFTGEDYREKQMDPRRIKNQNKIEEDIIKAEEFFKLGYNDFSKFKNSLNEELYNF